MSPSEAEIKYANETGYGLSCFGMIKVLAGLKMVMGCACLVVV